MFTSDIKRENFSQVNKYQEARPAVIEEGHAEADRNRLIAAVYLGIAAFCVVFCLIYEHFSFGEHADCMRRMFLVPLLGGALPFGALAVTGSRRQVGRLARNLWNSGIAVVTSGCLVKGIIEISGRFSDYDMLYWVSGGVLLAAGATCALAKKTENSK